MESGHDLLVRYLRTSLAIYGEFIGVGKGAILSPTPWASALFSSQDGDELWTDFTALNMREGRKNIDEGGKKNTSPYDEPSAIYHQYSALLLPS